MKLHETRQFSIRELASLIGTLVSMFPGVEFGPLHYRALERDEDLALKMAGGNFEAKMTLSQSSIIDLKR